MTYLVIGAAARDEGFQDRCWGSIVTMSNEVINSTLGSNTILSETGYDLTGQASKNQALNFVRGKAKASKEVIANFMLLNADISANPLGSADAAVQWQTKQIWENLVTIGYNE
jgi:hypothetical protein